jgi:fibronectin-binding autotransporter adhesin
MQYQLSAVVLSAANWSAGVPTSSSNAVIANGGTANVTQLSETCRTLSLGSGAGSGSVQMTSGSLSTSYQLVGDSGLGTFSLAGGTNSIASFLYVGNGIGSSGTYNLSGNGLLSAAFEIVASRGTGTITQSGGTNSIFVDSGQLYIGDGTGYSGSYNLTAGLLSIPGEDVAAAGTGTFTQTGGTNSVGGYGLGLGYSASSSGTYSLSGSGLVSAYGGEGVGGSGLGVFMQSGGTNAASSLYLGANTGSSGTYGLSGSGLLSAASEVVGYYYGTGIFTQSGGINIVKSLCLSNNSFPFGYVASGNGTYNLNGGVVILSSLSQGSGTASFNFSGGTLQASASFSTGLPMTLGTSGGGATFNTAGFAVTLSGPLSGPGGLMLNDTLGTGTLILTASNTYAGGTAVSAGALQLGDGVANNGYVQGNILNNGAVTFASPAAQTYAGVISGSGSLTKVGNGVLALGGSNTYTGPTTINQGELIVNGSLTSPVMVNSGGMLGGSGTLTSVTVASGGSLSPGAAPGALNVSGSLSLLSGAKMDYALDTPTDSDEVYMPSGPLVLSGQQFADFNFTPLGGFGPGTYTLIDTNSVPIGSLGTSTSGTIDGLPANIAVQGDDVVLNVVPEPGTLGLLGVVAVALLGYRVRLRRRRAVQASVSCDNDAPATLSFPSRLPKAMRRAA